MENTNLTQLPGSVLEQAETRRAALFVVIARVSLAALVVFLVLCITAGFLVPGYPSVLLSAIVGGTTALVALSLALHRRIPYPVYTGLYIGAVNTMLLAIIPLVGGMASATLSPLLVVALLAGLLHGQRGMLVTILAQFLVVIGLMVLEAQGMIHPYMLPVQANLVFFAALFFISVGVTYVVMVQFIHVSEGAFTLAESRGARLARAMEEVEVAAETERKARREQAEAAQQRELLLQKYSDFLQRVARGDYSARLDLTDADIFADAPEGLVSLGRYLNETVDALVSALGDLQVVQQRYLSDAWGTFLASGAVKPAFRYQNAQLEAAEDAWLSSMRTAVKDKRLEVRDDELAIPIEVRGEVIGALGIRREAAQDWSEDDRALVEAIVYQLGQTLDNLRLVEQTQRRAAREQLLSEVTSHIRETLDIETVLKTAAGEIRQALNVSEVAVRLIQFDDNDDKN